MSGHASSTKAILYAFFANLGLAFTKLSAAFYTGSGSLMAEAIHSFDKNSVLEVRNYIKNEN